LGGEQTHKDFYLYADEFQSFAGTSVGTWRELLSRGRKYNLSLTLAHQYPTQIPTALQDEIFGNVSSMVIFSLGGKDANAVKRELLHRDEKGEIKPIPAPLIVEQKIGHAFIKLGGGRAVGVQTQKPYSVQNPERAQGIIKSSWEHYKREEPQTPQKKQQEPTPRQKPPEAREMRPKPPIPQPEPPPPPPEDEFLE